jgi:signal peptidase I
MPSLRHVPRQAAFRRIGVVGFAALVAAWFVVLRPQSLGGPVDYVIVRGISMLPTYQNGDLVGVRAADTYTAGDAVAYRVPAGDIAAGRVVIHRLVGGNAESGFVVRGDNNANADPWAPRGSDIVGKVWLVMPGVGRLIVFLRQPVILAGLAAALMVSWAMLRVQPGDRRKRASAVRTPEGLASARRSRSPG